MSDDRINLLPLIVERFEKVRKDHGLSQEAFSKRLGISRGAYQHYCRASREIPSTAVIALSQEFGVDPSWVLFGSPFPPSIEIGVQASGLIREAIRLEGITFSHDQFCRASAFMAEHMRDQVCCEQEGLLAARAFVLAIDSN